MNILNLFFLIKKKPDSSKSYSKVGKVTGDQHLGDSRKHYPCFKCDRYKPDCMGARKCKFTVKIDGIPINSQEIINKKFKELKEAKIWTRINSATIGTQLMGEAEIVQSNLGNIGILPTLEEVIHDEASHDGHTAWEW